jgi:DNA-directed RNA polymerase specialized sigma24 family protein
MTSTKDPFDSVDWIDLHRRLLEVANRLSRLLTRDKLMAGTGFSVEDLVTETIVKALGRDEIRYQAERGNLFSLLKTAMERDFLDLLKKRSYRTTVHVDLIGDEASKDARLRDRAQSSREWIAEFLGDLRKSIAGERDLEDYVDAIEIGCETPAEIADVCQVDVTEIYRRRRRLKRRFGSDLVKGGQE